MGFDVLIKFDQQAIKHLLNQTTISHRHIKWAGFIQNFHPMIQYQHGKANVVADALSCRPDSPNTLSSYTFDDIKEVFLNHISVVEIQSFNAMIDTYVSDSDFGNAWNEFQNTNEI